MSPFASSAANIAISINHVLFVVIGLFVAWLVPWGWPIWVVLVIILGPMLIIDGIIWPLVYMAAKQDFHGTN